MYCKLFFYFTAHPSTKTTKIFFKAYKVVTDFGACCEIVPYLNFVNPQTIKLDPQLISAEHLHAIPRGSQNGELGGIEIVLDAESFAFSTKEKNTVGFRIAFSDSQDKQTMRKEGDLISTGIINQFRTRSNIAGERKCLS
jgi:hypothetical protein